MLINDINFVLSFLPSEVYKNTDAKDRLISVMSQLGQPINRGCPDCYNRAYFKLMKLKKNDYFINNTKTMHYKFREDLHSYRSKKTGKVLTNVNSTIEERKQVYDQSKSHQSLFDLETIPIIKKIAPNTYINQLPKKQASEPTSSKSTTSTKPKRTRKKATTTTKK